MKPQQENIITKNVAAKNTIVRQHNWMNWTNISEIIWKMFQSGTFHMDYHTILPRLTSFSILLLKTSNIYIVSSVPLNINLTLPNCLNIENRLLGKKCNWIFRE